MRQEIWFQKYQIIKLLGRGSTAKVYLAEHILLKSYRAIKCISKKHPLYEFHCKEAILLKNLKHPCIPIIYDIEEDDNCAYIIEQYIEGQTLKDYIQEKGPIDENIIIHFAIQLCDLITYLHSIERPIIYMDFKPENIIIADATIKLIDFGSAIYQDELSEQLGFCATKGYAAPELYQGKNLDERCNIYGIGMLLYYMVTGIYITKTCDQIKNIDLSGCCSKQLKHIINRCLKFNPSLRYSSVKQLSKHLSALIRKNRNYMKINQSLKIAVAGAQERIGVSHLSFRICSHFIHRRQKCAYEEKNNSGCVSRIKSRYIGLFPKDGIYECNGIPMLPKGCNKMKQDTEYPICVQDYGLLTKENFKEFLKANVKILVIGAKDWELASAEQALEITKEHKDILYFFNYLNGKQFQQVIKSMEQRNCYRIPYEPDPFAKPKQKSEIELLNELVRMLKV
ncbi:MAG: serine/threonine protein kinase [Clostridiales bacterium]|nr:serine/threonine protein kinase [Clostridiales bacterium]